MQVAVTFRHIAPSEGIRSHAIEKIERLQKFLRKPIEVHAILSVVKRRQIAEVVVTGKGIGLSATAETSDLYAAIDQVVEKMERQLKKISAKRKSHRGGSATIAAAPAPVAPPVPKVRVRRQRTVVRALTVAEAVARLGQSRVDYLLFENVDGQGIALLYRRKDGAMALVEPEMPA